jgi:hypothetical protein
MKGVGKSILSGLNRQSVEAAARTTAAATISLVVAQAFALPEAYWAAITSVIVIQSSTRRGAGFPLPAELSLRRQRFCGIAVT